MVSTRTHVLLFDTLPRQISNYVNKQNNRTGTRETAERQERKQQVKLVHSLREGEKMDIHSRAGKSREEEGNLGNV
jgi:hypothetical protein